MDFKLNAWTLLFAIAAIAAAYFYNCQCDVDSTPTEITTNRKPNKCKDLPPPDYEIPDSSALQWIDRYKEYAEGFKPNKKILNPNVIYFTLPRCEMEEMIEDIGADSDVKAHLAIKDNGEIVLVLQDVPYTDGVADGGGGGGFFDFTQPCPTFCE